MQPKAIHDTAQGFRVLDQDAAAAVVRRHTHPSLAKVTDDWEPILRRTDGSIDFDVYRRRVTAPRARAPSDAAVWLSAGGGVLAIAAIYLALFLAAAHTRAENDIQPTGPIVAIPNAPDVIF